MTSAFYLLGGIGSTDFAGDTKFTVNFGGGYRVVPTDWLAVHITVQDRVFQSSLLGVRQAHQQHRGAHRHDRLLLRWTDYDEQTVSQPLAAALLLSVPALAGAPGAAAPQFSLAARGGQNVSLAQYKGQVVMINFWASWCGPCRQEMPLLEGIYKKYNKLGFHADRGERGAGLERRQRVAEADTR